MIAYVLIWTICFMGRCEAIVADYGLTRADCNAYVAQNPDKDLVCVEEREI